MPPSRLPRFLLSSVYLLVITSACSHFGTRAATPCNLSIVADTFITVCSNIGIGSISPSVTIFSEVLTWTHSANDTSVSEMVMKTISNQSLCWLQVAYKSPTLAPVENGTHCVLTGNSSIGCTVAWRTPCLVSPPGTNCTAKLTDKGDLVLESNGTVGWSSNTTGKGVEAVRVSNNGVMELVNGKNASIWSSSDVSSSEEPSSVDQCLLNNLTQLPSTENSAQSLILTPPLLATLLFTTFFFIHV